MTKTTLNLASILLFLFFPVCSFSQDRASATESPFDKLERNNLSLATRTVLPDEVVEVLGSDGGRHSNAGKCVALSPNQKMVASGSRDGTVRLWNSETLAEIRRFPHPDDVDAVYFDNESEHLLTECWDGFFRVFDLASESNLPVSQVRVNRGRFKSTFLPGKNLIYATKGESRKRRDEPMLILEYEWNGASVKATGREINGLITLNESPKNLAISPDGRWLAGAIEGFDSGFGRVTIWDLNAKEPFAKNLEVLQGERATAVCFDFTESRLFVGGADGRLAVVDADYGAVLAVHHDHKDSIETIQISPDGSQLYTGSDDHLIHVYDCIRGELKSCESLSGHTDWVKGITCANDGMTFFSIGWEGTIRLWNRQNEKWIAASSIGHQNPVCSIAISDDCQWIATGSTTSIGAFSPNDVFLWKFTGQRFELDRKLSGAKGYIRSLSFSKDGKLLVAAHDRGMVGWELSRGDRAKVFEKEIVEYGEVSKALCQFVTFLGDTHRVISGWNQGLVAVVDFSFEQPEERANWKAPFYHIESIAVSANGKQAFVSSIQLKISENELTLIGPSQELDEKERQKSEGPEEVGEFLVYRPVKQAFGRVALSRDHQFLVGSDNAGTMTVIDAKAKADDSPTVISSHQTRVEAIDFGKEGSMASGDLDGVVQLWDFSNGDSPIKKIKLERVWALKFAPDGRHVAIGCGNGLVYILRVDRPQR